jgi:DNA polymerase (family X)
MAESNEQVYHLIEIKGDGSLDYFEELLRQCGSLTSSRPRCTQVGARPGRNVTRRVMQALANPYVAILNHPSGRILNRGEPYDVDLAGAIGLAAQNGVAMEVNGTPDRLDLDEVWTRRAKTAGVPLSVSSDAHARAQLGFVRWGLAVARRAWLEPADVVNVLPLGDLLLRLGRLRRAAWKAREERANHVDRPPRPSLRLPPTLIACGLLRRIGHG